MAAVRDVLQLLIELLQSVFSQFPVPPLNPDKRTAEEIEDDERFEVNIPVPSGKMSFAAEERRTEIVARLALSEEAVASGLSAKAREWADAAERTIPKRFPKLEKHIKIAITEIRAKGDVLPLQILTIDARRR